MIVRSKRFRGEKNRDRVETERDWKDITEI